MDEQTIYHKNAARMKKKWPEILGYIEALEGELNVNLIKDMPQETLAFNESHLSSCYDREHEAEIQNSTIPHFTTNAHLYGVGLGDAVYNLLHREQLVRLDVYLLSPTVFYIYLNFFDASWLDDERVHLHLAHTNKLQTPYSVNAGELPLTEDKSLEIKNLIEIDRNKENQKHFHQVKLASIYKDNLLNNQIFLNHDQYIETLKNKYAQKKFILIAGGPTATEQFSWLKKQNHDFIIIAANTALIPLEIEGITPDFVVAIDPLPLIAKHFELKYPKNYRHKTLVYQPSTSHEAVKTWPGIRKISLDNSNPLLQKQVLAHSQSVLYSGGSVAHTITALAVLLGAQEITLIGFDFCFAYGQSHLKNNSLQIDANQTAGTWLLNGKNKKIPSQINLISYKKALEEFIAINPHIKFYNTGMEGAEIKGTTWL